MLANFTLFFLDQFNSWPDFTNPYTQNLFWVWLKKDNYDRQKEYNYCVSLFKKVQGAS